MYKMREESKSSLLKYKNLTGVAALSEERNNMTKREFMEAIAAGTMTEEAMQFATDELKKMDEAAKKRLEKAAEKKAELEPIMDKIYEDILGDEPVTATVIGERLEISTQKASAIMRKMVEAGKATKTDIKVQKRTVKGYTRA